MSLENAKTIQGELAKKAGLIPHRTAIKDERVEQTYAELDRRANQVAHLLDETFPDGATVALLLPNRIEWAELLYGSFRSGIIPAGINFHFTADQIQYAIESIDADGLIVDEEFSDRAAEVRNELPDRSFVVLGQDERFESYESLMESSTIDELSERGISKSETGMLLFTSGTTGMPKPIKMTQASYITGFFVHSAVLGVNETDNALLLMPFFHGNSMFYFMMLHYHGGSVYVERGRGFDPDRTLSKMVEHDITFTSMVPTHFTQMLHDTDIRKYALSSLQTVLSSSAPLSQAVKKQLIETLDCDIFEGYGSVEAGIQIMLRPKDQLRKVGSVGTPIPGSDVLVLDDETKEPVEQGEIGEIYTQGTTTFESYYGMPDKTEEVTLERENSTWVTAGDMGRIDDDGFVYMVQRKNDMIITGGENVYPSHIEDVLHEHEGVKDVAVIGIPHDKWGEAVHAVVIPATEAISESELIDYCRGQVAAHEVPKKVDFVNELPRTPTGKILRREVRQGYWDGERDYSNL